MRRALFSIGLAVMAVPTAGQACSVFIPPAERIERGYQQETIEAVAVIAVEDATHTQSRMADTHPWKATGSVVQTIRGSGLPETIEFERGWGSSACEWNLPPLPVQGDRWVVYFWIDRDGKHRPWLTVPLLEARQFDPQIRLAL